METREYTTIDRASLGWPSGEWDGEPDKAQWQDAETGLPCLAVRHGNSGHWCGYVGVNDGHPHFGQGYECPDVSVHGGLTYADFCMDVADESGGVCHVPGKGEPDHVWWFGFDCAHCDDRSPRDEMYSLERGYPYLAYPGQSYKTLAYVKSQCASLALQLRSCQPSEQA